MCKLEDLCHKVDVSPLLTRQKLKVYNLGICPRLAWLLSLQDLSTTWAERSVEAIATRYLKRWCRLARSADVSRLYLPHTSGGLQLRAISSLYKCSHISRYHLLLSSKDGRVKRLAEEKLKWFTRNKSLKFNHFDYLQKCTIVSTSSPLSRLVRSLRQYWRWLKDYPGVMILKQEDPMLARSFLKVQPYAYKM